MTPEEANHIHEDIRQLRDDLRRYRDDTRTTVDQLRKEVQSGMIDIAVLKARMGMIGGSVTLAVLVAWEVIKKVFF